MGKSDGNRKKAVGLPPKSGEKFFSARLSVSLVRSMHRSPYWIFICYFNGVVGVASPCAVMCVLSISASIRWRVATYVCGFLKQYQTIDDRNTIWDWLYSTDSKSLHILVQQNINNARNKEHRLLRALCVFCCTKKTVNSTGSSKAFAMLSSTAAGRHFLRVRGGVCGSPLCIAENFLRWEQAPAAFLYFPGEG